MGEFNAGGDIVKFTVSRSINANGNDPYGGPSADFTVLSREWHSGQDFCSVLYGEHGSGSGAGGFYIRKAGPRDLASGGYWFYMELEGGIDYIVRRNVSSGYLGNFASTTDPGNVPQIISKGYNLLGLDLSGMTINSRGNIDNHYISGGAEAWRFIFPDSSNSGGYGAGASAFGIYRNTNSNYSAIFKTNGDVELPFSTISASFKNYYDNSTRLENQALILRGQYPTVYFRDTDHLSSMIHVNSNLLYILRGEVDAETWTQNGSGYWPAYWSLSNNDMIAGGNIYAGTYYSRAESGYYLIPNGTSNLYRISLNQSGYYMGAGDWGWRHTTPNGWIQFGPANIHHAHVYTDRDNFYFNVNTLYTNGNLVWTAGNDGAGTSLDADLLDSYQLSGESSISDKIFNNKGLNHPTFTDFNTVMKPGANYIFSNPDNDPPIISQNTPIGTGGQWYGFMLGLGDNYGTSTGVGANYASQLYYARAATGGSQYLYARDLENGTWQSWRKLYAGYADSAGSVAWTNVTGRPTALSSFSNDSGYLTSVSWGIISGRPTSLSAFSNDPGYITSSSLTWANISGRPTSLSDFTNDPGFITSAALGSYISTSGGTITGDLQVRSLGVGTAPSGVTGEIRATGNITAYYSDARLKNFISRITNPLEKLLKLNGYYYVENETANKYGFNNKEEQVGVSAQEIEKVLPQIVTRAPFDIGKRVDGTEYSKSGEEYKTVRYERLVPLLIEAIKEQQYQIEELKNQFKSLNKL
jgi:hypothetical protein